MKLVITDGAEPQKDGTFSKSQGGTERMLQGLRERVDPKVLDKFQIICSRVRDLEDKPRILWLHDTAADPETEHLGDAKLRKRFARLVFVSQYQFQTYHQKYGIPYHESIVLRNAIVPFAKHEKPRDKINIIYHTTPHRGLEILVPVFIHLAKTRPELHLHVFSSFSIYGWEHRDEPYEYLFDMCRKHPQITYHGARPNDEVRAALKDTHIFAYPSIWQETSCIAAIEAMSAGCLVVCPDLAALPETVSDFGYVYRWDEDVNIHANRFFQVLETAINDFNSGANFLDNGKKRADSLYSWDRRKLEWDKFLASIPL